MIDINYVLKLNVKNGVVYKFYKIYYYKVVEGEIILPLDRINKWFFNI